MADRTLSDDHPTVRCIAGRNDARMAWASCGKGPGALIVCSGWVSHLQLEWEHPDVRAFYQGLAERRRLIRYDRPGLGLADRHAYDFSLEAELDHLGRVIAASGERTVALLGCGLSGPLAMAFAARHPERISHLVLFGTSTPIVANEGFPQGLDPALTDALERLVLADWSVGSSALSDVMLPGVAPAVASWYAEFQRSAASATVAAELLRSRRCMDITPALRRITVPTLVMHRRSDRAISLAAAQRTAAGIPHARLHVLDGSENPPFAGDRDAVIAAIDGFLDPSPARLTDRELEILSGVADGLRNRAIAAVLGLSEHTVARHVANTLLKLDVCTRSAAVAQARRAALIP